MNLNLIFYFDFTLLNQNFYKQKVMPNLKNLKLAYLLKNIHRHYYSIMIIYELDVDFMQLASFQSSFVTGFIHLRFVFKFCDGYVQFLALINNSLSL